MRAPRNQGRPTDLLHVKAITGEHRPPRPGVSDRRLARQSAEPSPFVAAPSLPRQACRAKPAAQSLPRKVYRIATSEMH